MVSQNLLVVQLRHRSNLITVVQLDNNQKTYTLIQEMKSWTDAQAYCREHHTDLAMIENDQENMQVMSVLSVSAYSAWIGLYRQPCRWSDNSSSSFTNWRDGEPNNGNRNQYCVAESSDHLWIDESCDNKLAFWCYGGEKKNKN
uniref:C-type lectin domain-containing protein n=1 Tax=Acanthochromis polyacanthus TaxID=80966 RepID=A0A3Q1GTE2_9TELE